MAGRLQNNKIVTRLLLLVGIALLGSAGCGYFNDCDPPDTTEYSCEPISPQQEGCIGGPTFGGERRDPDKTFPAGCEARLPFCVDSHPDSVQTCTCEASGGMWSCPI